MRGDRLLVIGYGNPLRSDDGAGLLVAEAVASWNRSGVRSIAVPQLAPELAEHLARVPYVLFVDARVGAEGMDLDISPIEPAGSLRPAGHLSDPRSLLALTRWLHGRSPRARLLTVPGVDFAIGEVISGTAAGGIDRALEWISEEIDRLGS